MLVAPATTWLFVSISPAELSTTPVPAADPPWKPSLVLMSTTPWSVLAAVEPPLALVAVVAVEVVCRPSTANPTPIPAIMRAATDAASLANHRKRRLLDGRGAQSEPAHGSRDQGPPPSSPAAVTPMCSSP